ncbi:type 1 glutamine amidotransferase [Thiohalorhabdus methylotrophus]|uniref:Type 1 glutamine amidotransferase n=1 Tax=Thiohalorhabdus methylotrophus TaxID=3242694 RepID=A0ABV4TZ99_9GAMM
MLPVWIFRHVAHEGPGYFADFLRARGLPFEVVAVDAGEPVPSRPDGASGLVFMGGPMSVNDPLPWVPAEVDLIRQAHARGMPVLGHCLGGQLIARAMGSTVGPGEAPEIGWFPVDRVPGEAADSWLRDLPGRFEVFHWHGERFGLPAGASPLLTNGHTPSQGFVSGNCLALQCHVEMKPDLVRDWAEINAAQLAEPRPSTVQGREELTDGLEERCRSLHKVADQLYGRWVEGLS